jgi:multicomponent Na+:H+ antiporter subunit B
VSPRARLILFLAGAAVLLPLLVWGMLGLPDFGHYPGPYGDILTAIATAERHVLNVVTAINFDYRGFDTLGEEFILFTAITGVSVILRTEGELESYRWPGEPEPRRGIMAYPSDAVQLVAPGFAMMTLVYGAYTILTGHLGLGGGFQGGVLVSAAWLIFCFALGSRIFSKLGSQFALELLEAAGAAAYGLVGLTAMLYGQAFLTNIFPLGQTGSLFSSGTIMVIDVAVGLEVAAGFILLIVEFAKPLQSLEPWRLP